MAGERGFDRTDGQMTAIEMARDAEIQPIDRRHLDRGDDSAVLVPKEEEIRLLVDAIVQLRRHGRSGPALRIGERFDHAVTKPSRLGANFVGLRDMNRPPSRLGGGASAAKTFGYAPPDGVP